ncbi:hypothetical protein [Spirosoma areae]
METTNDDQGFDFSSVWMNDPDEIARRLVADPKLFQKLHPQYIEELCETHRQKIINDPMFYVVDTRRFLEMLPANIDDAKRGADSTKLRKLKVLQDNIEYILCPSPPIHPIIIEFINEHDEELYDYLLIVRELIRKITDNTPTQEAPTPKAEEAQYKTFEELFISPANINKCLDVLRAYRPEKPILGEGTNWLGGPNAKAVLIAWIERMESMNPQKINKLSNRKQLVALLNAYFPALKMGIFARSFDNIIDADIKDKITAMMPE